MYVEVKDAVLDDTFPSVSDQSALRHFGILRSTNCSTIIITAKSQEVTRNSVKSHVQCESKIQRCPFKSTEVMSHTCCLQIINLFSHLAVRTRLNRVHRLLLTDLPVIEKPACTQ